MLLSFTLWIHDVWGWSALRTGLAVAPGPLLVPFLAVATGRLAARVGPAPLVATGGLLFAAGLVWPAVTAGPEASYPATFLPAMLLTGIGVGLVLPTTLASSAVALPPDRFATGSAVVSTVRQIASVIGVCVFVAALGTPGGPGATEDAFARAWYLLAGLSLLAVPAALLTRRAAGPATASPATVSPAVAVAAGDVPPAAVTAGEVR
jgi:MFS family permease